MMREAASRSILITICLLLGLTALGSTQSGQPRQQHLRGVTVVPNTPRPSPTERRVALVIGNSTYQYTKPLNNPVNDAQDIAKVLKELQFQVLLKTDATLDTMADALFEFGERLKGGGVGLLYYSGHGMQVKGENYLIPIDANIVREDDIKRRTINAKDVLDKMDEAKSHFNLVFLDACRNNPFPRSVRAVSRGLAGMNAPTGTLLVFATNPDNVASDGAGRNGTYTKYLLHYITQPGLEVGMMLRKVRTAVKEETGGQQVPWENGSIEGEFYFNGLSGVSPVTPPSPSPSTASTSGGTQGAVGSHVPTRVFVEGFNGPTYVRGVFEKRGPNSWSETSDQSKTVLKFTSDFESPERILLRDNSRNMLLEIDLNTRTTRWKLQTSTTWNRLYNVTGYD